ncbi:MAG TPA: hypothetical protein PLX23_00435 [Candidatus Hydrogenedens sp.]|nr:hypothetical protein [Candidatus Hydrogenedens sp.]
MNRYLVCVFVMVLSGMMFICSDVYAMRIQFDSIERLQQDTHIVLNVPKMHWTNIERLQKQDTQITLSMSAIQIEDIKGLSKVENDALCEVKLQEIGNDTGCPNYLFYKERK